MEQAQSKISYLKIITPKASSGGTENQSTVIFLNRVKLDSGVKKFSYVNGKCIEGGAETIDGARHHVGDLDATIKRHQALKDRQFFGGRK